MEELQRIHTHLCVQLNAKILEVANGRWDDIPSSNVPTVTDISSTIDLSLYTQDSAIYQRPPTITTVNTPYEYPLNFTSFENTLKECNFLTTIETYIHKQYQTNHKTKRHNKNISSKQEQNSKILPNLYNFTQISSSSTNTNAILNNVLQEFNITNPSTTIVVHMHHIFNDRIWIITPCCPLSITSSKPENSYDIPVPPTEYILLNTNLPEKEHLQLVLTELQNSFRHNRQNKELEVHNAQINLWKAQARLYSHIAISDIVEMHPSMIHQLPFTRTLSRNNQLHIVGITYVLQNYNIRLGTLFIRKKKRIPETIFLEIEYYSSIHVPITQDHFFNIFNLIVPHSSQFNHYDSVDFDVDNVNTTTNNSVSSDTIDAYYVSSLHFPLFKQFRLSDIFDSRHNALQTAFAVQHAPNIHTSSNST